MNKRLKHLFEQLNKSWNISGPDFKGENPACIDLQNEILNEFKKNDSGDILSIIKKLSDEQIEQITPIVEDIIEIFPDTKTFFIAINSERKIDWLDSELRYLNLID